jgi:hypothetical protein
MRFPVTDLYLFVTAKNDPFDPFGDGGAERSASKTPVDVSFFVYIGYMYVYVLSHVTR